MKNILLFLSFLFASLPVFSQQTPFLSIFATSADKAEGNTGTTAFTFVVVRDGNTSGFSSADWAVTGSGGNPANAADFGGTLPSGTVNFSPTQTTRNITVNVTGDTDVEPDEGFTVTLSNPTNAIITTATADGNIQNDDIATTSAETLDFDGTDDHVVLPANLTASLTDFTFEAWVYWDGATNWQRIMDFGENTDIYMYLTPQAAVPTEPIFAITTSGSGGEQRINSSVPATVGQWQHYAVVLDAAANTGTLYIDGAQVGQNTNMTLTPADLGNLPNNYLGKAQFSFDPYFDGKLDEVRIWNFAKTASQVNCQKDFELLGTEPGLVAYYNFNQGTAGGNNAGVTTLDDLTTNNNDGTLTDFALTGAGSNWVEPGAPVSGTSSGCCPSGNVLYVNDDASGNNDGTSWADAFNDLQDALSEADNCSNITQIWVAAGTYKPTSGTDRTISFEMLNDLAIYGGFDGTETMLGERDWVANVTTLSGDIGTTGDNSDNSYHVISNDNNGLNGTALLDGFTISGGNANGGSPHFFDGGGMYNNNSSPTVTNCSFSGNYANDGGGMSNNNSSPTVTNCSFSGNNAGSSGGGMYNGNSSPTVTNCSFSGNNASISGGGGMVNANSSPTVTNCSFFGNNTGGFGGGMSNLNSSSTVTNCSFSGNNAGSSGGGMYNNPIFAIPPVVTNCIFWGNNTEIENLTGTTPVTYSIVQGGYAGTGNLDVDPLFVSQPPIGLGTTGDLHLQNCSPAKDVGTATGAPATDFDGDARPQGAGFDMGFDESTTSCCPSGNVLFVDDDASGNNDGTSWADAFNDLQDALAEADNCSNITQIWVAAGTYKPTSGTDRTISFAMQNDLAIYGGFDGTETMLGERDWVANVTTLSGDIGTTGDNSDNSYRVIVNTDLNNSALIDGFTISGGYADGFNGGGMLNDNSSPTISNCVFTDNLSNGGGAMANTNSSSPVITGCSFTENTGQGNGGAVLNQSSSPSFSNCSFIGNSAIGRGGGVHALSGSPAFTNCVFSGNSANSPGGGLSLNASTSTLMNCSFSGSDGDGVYAENSSATITNSILWGNGGELGNSGSTFTVTYSIVQGGFAGTGNLDVDPLFVSQPPIGLGTTGDLHLQNCSPAKDVGTATGAPATDFDGDARPQGAGFDMGFDESTTSCCPPGNIVYVDADATGANSGTSWADAYTDLQDALADTCSNITQIWVAEGTYKPTSGTDRTVSFEMLNDLAIYGGFDGTETMLGERDWVANVTTLSGDIGTPGDNSDNSNHVISNNGLNSTAVLDGFTVSGGNADEASGFPFFLGGGMYNVSSSPTVANCSFSGNSANAGGGMYNNNNSSPTVTSCSFSGNYADNGGGGMRNFNSSNPTVINTSFSGNYADTLGGAMYNVNSSPILTNSSFSGNGAGIGGGVMYNLDGSPTVTNCILWGNSTVFENINASNPTVTYSIVQGGYAGTGNLDVDPLFVSQPPIGLGTTGDLHLQACSPAKDAGTATGAPATDFDGDARPQGAGFDMGFDENGDTCSPGNCPPTLNVTGTIASGTFQAQNSLTSNGTVPNGNTVELKAGNEVLLNANFEVILGGVLDVIMEVCTPLTGEGEGQ